MVFRQLLCIPDGEFVAKRFFRDLIFWQGLNLLVVYKQPIDIQQFLAGRIRWFELNDSTAFGIFDSGKQSLLKQLRLVLELHNNLPACRPRAFCAFFVGQ